MRAKPDEIANLCTLFGALATNRLPTAALERHLRTIMPIDFQCTPTDIVEEGVSCGLIALDSGKYALTNLGRQLAKRQGDTSTRISEPAKEFLLKKVYLNIDAGPACCGSFLVKFRVDTVLGTFVYERFSGETEKETQWLMLLARVGLVDVNENIASIRRKYLDAVNQLLQESRLPHREESSDGDVRNLVGNIAERCALDYEKTRLSERGYPELSRLVQRISLVDRSAGYDIRSFRGAGRIPDAPMYVEVKGTLEAKVSFHWSRNERRVAAIETKSYWIYAYTNVDLRLETAEGPVRFQNPMAKLEKLGYEFEPLDVFVREGRALRTKEDRVLTGRQP